MKTFNESECLDHFREYCKKVTNLQLVIDRVKRAECPFLDSEFEKDERFRASRRYYRKHIHNGLSEKCLKVIEEIQNE